MAWWGCAICGDSGQISTIMDYQGEMVCARCVEQKELKKLIKKIHELEDRLKILESHIMK